MCEVVGGRKQRITFKNMLDSKLVRLSYFKQQQQQLLLNFYKSLYLECSCLYAFTHGVSVNAYKLFGKWKSTPNITTMSRQHRYHTPLPIEIIAFVVLEALDIRTLHLQIVGIYNIETIIEFIVHRTLVHRPNIKISSNLAYVVCRLFAYPSHNN
jgi:hypothetical protein